MTVPQSEDLVDMAFRRGRKASSPKGAPGQRGKNRELARVGTAARTLESRLHRVVRNFPSMEDLHPFYRDLADVLVGMDELKHSLGAVDWARKQIQAMRSETERMIRKVDNDHERTKARKQAYGRMASVVHQVSDELAYLEKARYELAGLPTVQLDRPTLVVAGFPNVGKSSFLEHVTRATPEIAPYPFTTKGVSLGNTEHRRHNVQIMDTPGLLDRPLDERNDIERQAILALTHVADAILFMLDPSGHCGYPLEAQLRLLEEVEASFQDVPLIVVENKSDLETTGTRPAMSCETGEGVDEVAKLGLDAVVEVFEQDVLPSWD